MSTIYLHIGTMKTGTTAIQNFLTVNAEEIQKRGYCYPLLNLGIKKTNLRNANFLIWRSENDNMQERLEEEKAVREAAYIQLKEFSEKYENIILSEELIWHHSKKFKGFWKDRLEHFKEIGCDVKVIVYLRRQDLLVQSLWNQLVKMGGKLRYSFDEAIQSNFFKYFPLDYYTHLKRIERFIGKENLIVRVYEREQFEGKNNTIHSDFLEQIGLEWSDEFVVENSEVNYALEGNFIEIKRLINKLPEYREMTDFMMRPVVRASAYQAEEDGLAKMSLFKPEEQIKYLEQFEESNKKVAQEYLGRTDGILFREGMKKLPLWEVKDETMNRDLLIASAEIFCAQEQKILSLTDEIKKLRLEISELKKNDLAEMKKDIRSMHKSLIFKSYRKLRKVVKHKE